MLKTSSLFVALIGVISVMPSSLTAGYVAGRVAGRRAVLHGALSGCAWFVILIIILLCGTTSDAPPSGRPGVDPLLPALLGSILFFGTPLLGALGGFIARQVGIRRDQPAIAPTARARQFSSYPLTYWKK